MGLYALPPKLRNDIHILHAFLQIGFNMSIHQAPGIMPCAKKKKTMPILSTGPNSQTILLSAFQI